MKNKKVIDLNPGDMIILELGHRLNWPALVVYMFDSVTRKKGMVVGVLHPENKLTEYDWPDWWNVDVLS